MAESLPPSTSTTNVQQTPASSNFTDILNKIKIKSIEKTLAPLINQVSEFFFYTCAYIDQYSC